MRATIPKASNYVVNAYTGNFRNWRFGELAKTLSPPFPPGESRGSILESPSSLKGPSNAAPFSGRAIVITRQTPDAARVHAASA